MTEISEYQQRLDIANRVGSGEWRGYSSRHDKLVLWKFIAEVVDVDATDFKVLQERMHDDHIRLKKKYKLPDRNLKVRGDLDDVTYLRKLRDYLGLLIKNANEIDVSINSPESDPVFMELARGVSRAAFNSDLGVVLCDLEGETIDDLLIIVGSLEHELVHAHQHKSDSNMSIEQKEYEAHIVANYDPNNTDPIGVYGIIDVGVMRSVDFHNKQTGIIPEWAEEDIPKHFEVAAAVRGVFAA